MYSRHCDGHRRIVVIDVIVTLCHIVADFMALHRGVSRCKGPDLAMRKWGLCTLMERMDAGKSLRSFHGMPCEHTEDSVQLCSECMP